jgi:prepilin-type N-terminal cleavage/methylation domain-containing protein
MSRTQPADVERTGESGFTLLELMVALTVMSIFLTMFTTAIVQVFRSTNLNEATWTAQTQLSIAFLRLDKQIRYASAISTEGTVTGDPYIEYLTTGTGTPICTELRLDQTAAQLQLRTWTQGSLPTMTPWLPLVSDVQVSPDPVPPVTPPLPKPFAMLPADATFNFQRMWLVLVATSGGADTQATRTINITFAALNTSLLSPSPTVCTEGRAVP